jgi:hypothetical protein
MTVKPLNARPNDPVDGGSIFIQLLPNADYCIESKKVISFAGSPMPKIPAGYPILLNGTLASAAVIAGVTGNLLRFVMNDVDVYDDGLGGQVLGNIPIVCRGPCIVNFSMMPTTDYAGVAFDMIQMFVQMAFFGFRLVREPTQMSNAPLAVGEN